MYMHNRVEQFDAFDVYGVCVIKITSLWPHSPLTNEACQALVLLDLHVTKDGVDT